MFKSRTAGLFLLCLTCATPLCAQLNDSQKPSEHELCASKPFRTNTYKEPGSGRDKRVVWTMHIPGQLDPAAPLPLLISGQRLGEIALAMQISRHLPSESHSALASAVFANLLLLQSDSLLAPGGFLASSPEDFCVS
jgi:hypothetical protein